MKLRQVLRKTQFVSTDHESQDETKEQKQQQNELQKSEMKQIENYKESTINIDEISQTVNNLLDKRKEDEQQYCKIIDISQKSKLIDNKDSVQKIELIQTINVSDESKTEAEKMMEEKSDDQNNEKNLDDQTQQNANNVRKKRKYTRRKQANKPNEIKTEYQFPEDLNREIQKIREELTDPITKQVKETQLEEEISKIKENFYDSSKDKQDDGQTSQPKQQRSRRKYNMRNQSENTDQQQTNIPEIKVIDEPVLNENHKNSPDTKEENSESKINAEETSKQNTGRRRKSSKLSEIKEEQQSDQKEEDLTKEETSKTEVAEEQPKQRVKRKYNRRKTTDISSDQMIQDIEQFKSQNYLLENKQYQPIEETLAWIEGGVTKQQVINLNYSQFLLHVLSNPGIFEDVNKNARLEELMRQKELYQRNQLTNDQTFDEIIKELAIIINTQQALQTTVEVCQNQSDQQKKQGGKRKYEKSNQLDSKELEEKQDKKIIIPEFKNFEEKQEKKKIIPEFNIFEQNQNQNQNIIIPQPSNQIQNISQITEDPLFQYQQEMNNYMKNQILASNQQYAMLSDQLKKQQFGGSELDQLTQLMQDQQQQIEFRKMIGQQILEIDPQNVILQEQIQPKQNHFGRKSSHKDQQLDVPHNFQQEIQKMIGSQLIEQASNKLMNEEVTKDEIFSRQQIDNENKYLDDLQKLLKSQQDIQKKNERENNHELNNQFNTPFEQAFRNFQQQILDANQDQLNKYQQEQQQQQLLSPEYKMFTPIIPTINIDHQPQQGFQPRIIEQQKPVEIKIPQKIDTKAMLEEQNKIAEEKKLQQIKDQQKIDQVIVKQDSSIQDNINKMIDEQLQEETNKEKSEKKSQSDDEDDDESMDSPQLRKKQKLNGKSSNSQDNSMSKIQQKIEEDQEFEIDSWLNELPPSKFKNLRDLNYEDESLLNSFTPKVKESEWEKDKH